MMMDGEGVYVEQTKGNSMSRIIFFMSSYESSIELGHSQIKIIPERI